MNWIKENPKKSVAIVVVLAASGVAYKLGGVSVAIQLLSALLNFFA